MRRPVTQDSGFAMRKPPNVHTRKENTLNPMHSMIPMNSINAILDALASQQQHGETSLIVTIKPDLIQDAVNALRDYRKLFAPFIPGVTDPAPIYAAYQQMRARSTKHTILLLVECRTTEEFREALDRLPMRKASEWRALDDGHLEFVL